MSDPSDPDATGAYHPAPPIALTGERFATGALLADRYRIIAALGRGRMGEVYRADDLTRGPSVARESPSGPRRGWRPREPEAAGSVARKAPSVRQSSMGKKARPRCCWASRSPRPRSKILDVAPSTLHSFIQSRRLERKTRRQP